MIRRTLTLLAAATLAILDVILEARRERERLDRVLGKVLADIEAEEAERETLRPNVRGVVEPRSTVWVSPGGSC
jgi:hypothetical protein